MTNHDSTPAPMVWPTLQAHDCLALIDFLVEDTLEERKLAQLNLKRRVASAALDRRGATKSGEIENNVESLGAHLARTAY